MRDRDQAVAVNHYAAQVRALVDELVRTPLTDEREWALKLDGIVGHSGEMRALSRRAAEDERSRRAEDPRAALPPVEIGSWGRADEGAGLRE